MAIQSRSAAMVVVGPWPGWTVRVGERSARRWRDSSIRSGSAPGRSTRPQVPAKRVSPEINISCSSDSRQMPPGVWPGV